MQLIEKHTKAIKGCHKKSQLTLCLNTVSCLLDNLDYVYNAIHMLVWTGF